MDSQEADQLQDVLDRLARREGVRQANLRKVVSESPVLSQVFGLTDEDSLAEVQFKVSRPLTDFINELPTAKLQHVARYCFALTGDEAIDGDGALGRRQKALRGSEYDMSQRKAQSLMAEEVVPDLARQVTARHKSMLEQQATRTSTSPALNYMSEASYSNSFQLSVGWIRRRVKTSLTIVVVLLAVTALIWQQSKLDGQTSSKTDRSSRMTPVADKHSLLPTIVSVNTPGNNDSFVFDAAHRQASDALFAKADRAGVTPELAASAIQQGAYLYGGVKVKLTIEGLDSQTATIYNIRPITTRKPIPTDAVMYIESGGSGGVSSIDFDLDQRFPVAVEHHDGDGVNKPPRPFFDGETIDLGKGQKHSFALTFNAAQAAYEFRIAIDYEVGGKKYTTIVDNGGAPFRGTAVLCPRQSPGTQTRVPDSVKNAKYRAIRYVQPYGEVNTAAKWSMAEFRERC